MSAQLTNQCLVNAQKALVAAVLLQLVVVWLQLYVKH